MKCLDALISFDTPSDRRRRKLTRLLNRSGRRVQKSVFRVQGTPHQLADLWAALQHVCLPEEDALLLCHIHAGSWQQFGGPPGGVLEETCIF